MKKKPTFDLIASMRDFFAIPEFMPVIPWIQKSINLTDDVSSESSRPNFEKYPYQVEILKQWEDLTSRKRVTVCAVEQVGKSTLWVYGLLYRMVYDPCQSLVVYPSADKAVETNQTKLLPLMRHVPRNQRRA